MEVESSSHQWASKIQYFHDFDGEPRPAALELPPADLQSFSADSAGPPLSRNPGSKVLNKRNKRQDQRESKNDMEYVVFMHFLPLELVGSHCADSSAEPDQNTDSVLKG